MDGEGGSGCTAGKEQELLGALQNAAAPGDAPPLAGIERLQAFLQQVRRDETKLYDPLTGRVDPLLSRGLPGVADFAVASMPPSDMASYLDVLLLCLEEGIPFHVVEEAAWGDLWLQVWCTNQLRGVADGKKLLVLTEEDGSVGFSQTLELAFFEANKIPFRTMTVSSFLMQLRPLVQTAFRRDWEACEKLQSRDDVLMMLNQVQKSGLAPLHFFSQHEGAAKCLDLALVRKAAVDMPSFAGFTPLHVAAQFNQCAAASRLLAAGAGVGAKTKLGVVPALMAAEEGHSETLQFLAQQRADVNAQKGDGSSPAFMAAQVGHVGVLLFLARAGADLNLRRSDGSSPVFIAAQMGHVDALHLLAQYRADLEERGYEGASPALAATNEGHAEVLRLFATRGVDLAAPGGAGEYEGDTPQALARRLGHSEILQVLDGWRAAMGLGPHPLRAGNVSRI